MSHNEGAASSKSGRALAKNFLTSCDLVLPMLHEFPAICLLNIRDLWLSATAFVQPAAKKAEVVLRFPSVSAAFTNREIASTRSSVAYVLQPPEMRGSVRALRAQRHLAVSDVA